MRHTVFILLTAIYFSASVFSCSSLGRPEDPVHSPEQNNDINQADTATELSLQDGWTHEVIITNEGSRSQGSVSRLFYRYNEIPSVFNSITIGDTLLTYVPMTHLWDEYGYISEGSALECESVETIDRDALKEGWYILDGNCKYSGTPHEWVHVETETISAWVSPEKIDALISFFSLEPVPAIVHE